MLWASHLSRLARILLGSVAALLVLSLLVFTAQIHGSDLRTVLVVRVIDNATGVGLPAFVVLKGPENLARQMSALGIETLNLLPGTYTIMVSVSGYGSQRDNKTVLSGVQNRIRFQLSRVYVQNPPAPTPPPAPSPPPPPPAPAMGSVAGRITNASTGQGIVGATVSIGSLWSGMTDASGSFRSPQLAAGAHHVTASGAGYESVHQSVLVTAGQTAPANFALQPAVSSRQDCLWSDPRTWGGNIPSANSNVAIPTASCSTVTLDGDANVRSITVNTAGILKASTVKDTSLTLWAGNFVIYGTADWRTHREAVVRWTGIDEATFVGGHTHVPLASDPGLWVQEGGKLLVEGKPKLAWTRLEGAAVKGSSHIMVAEEPAGWEVGDELAIAPTLPPTIAGHYDAYDYPKVAAIAGRDITLDRPLSFDHPAVRAHPTKLMTAEVLNLTRNIIFSGEPGKRAHIIVNMANSPQVLRYFAIRWMGPQRPPDADRNVIGIVGRYGLHLHRMADASRGSLAEGIVLRDLGNNGFVPHGSHGVTARNVIVHNGYDNGFWWDPVAVTTRDRNYVNASHDSLWERCVASRITRLPIFRGFRIAGFSLNGGLNNSLIESVAIGIQGNADAAGMLWPEGESTEPNRRANPWGKPSGVWNVQRTVSHNNKIDGWFTWQNTSNVHDIGMGSVIYHNGGVGIDHGAYINGYIYRDITLYGNLGGGIRLRAVSSSQTPNPLMLTGLYIDQANMSDFAIVTGHHVLTTTRPTVIANSRFAGYRKAAVGVQASAEGRVPELIDMVDNTYAGIEVWIDNAAQADTKLRIQYTNNVTILLARKDTAGEYFEAKWNAMVTRIGPFSAGR